MIRADLKNLLLSLIRGKFGIAEVSLFVVEAAQKPEYGDYATNAALVLAKILKKPPMEIASAIAEDLRAKNPGLRTEAAPPGFINFWLSREALARELNEILKKKEKYGRDGKKEGKIQIEFISANPTGPLTVGNGRGAFLGDALSRVLSFYGFKVTREYYINDAKASTQIKELGKTGLGRGRVYLTPELERLISRRKPKIKKLVGKNPKNLEGEAGALLAAEVQKENRKFIEKVLKIKFDVWLSEEGLYERGETDEALERLKNGGFIYEKDGALWLKTSAGGDTEDRVLIRSSLEPTYFYSDLAAHLNKLRRGFAGIIYIWGADHHGHVARTRAALRLLKVPEGVFQFIIMQIVRLVKGGREVKMSKRAGTAILLEDLIKEVGLDAARYFFLEKSPDTHVDFDLVLAKERSVKNPVYYIQYAHARISSIFRKANLRKSDFPGKFYFQKLSTVEELGLIKKLTQFPEAVEDAAKDYQAHGLTRYAYELARSFHNFYEKHRVITEDRELVQARLALVKATQIVLKNVLGLLGISAPVKM